MVGETGRPLATFSRYDVELDRWNTLPSLPVPTRAAAAAAVDGELYVIGGTAATGNTAAVWSYRPSAGTWRARAPLPTPRFNHEAVALDGRIYVVGGYLAGWERDELFRYEPARDRWSLVGRLPRPTHAFGLVAYGGELWMIGGRRGEQVLRDVWIYDPRSGTWRRGPALRKPMELLGAAVAGDEIHAVWEETYQVYDAARRAWTLGSRPLVTRHALEAFVVGGVLVTVGGCTTALRDSHVVERLRIDGDG
jgi:N-acetylneuraminic acid mutarotase